MTPAEVAALVNAATPQWRDQFTRHTRAGVRADAELVSVSPTSARHAAILDQRRAASSALRALFAEIGVDPWSVDLDDTAN